MAWIAWRLGAAHRTALVIVLCGAIAGCAPWAWPYQHIDAPGARYFQTICRAGFGPPSRVYYPYHGIFISLDITDVVTLGLHLPEGSTAQIDGTSVHITGEGKTGPADVVIPIRATKHWGMDAPEFRQYPDPFTTPDNFGPLTGETTDGDYLFDIPVFPKSCRSPRFPPRSE